MSASSNQCAICDMPYGRYGNNGLPLVDGRVCNSCNRGVIEFRMDCAYGECKDMSDTEKRVSAQFKCMAMRCEYMTKKVETQKGVIEALQKSVEVEKENTKKFKDELDEIAKEECVAPMIDRIMEDAKKDVEDAEAKTAAKEEECRVHMGHRAQNHRCFMIAAESIFLTDCMEDIDNFMEQLGDAGADTEIVLSFCVAHPSHPNADMLEMLGCSVEDVAEHLRAERMMVGKMVRRFVVGSVGRAGIEVGEVRVCPHCEECNSMKITLREPQ